MHVVIQGEWWKIRQRYMGPLLDRRSRCRKGGKSLKKGLLNLKMKIKGLPSCESKIRGN